MPRPTRAPPRSDAFEVIVRQVNGKRHEPLERVVVDVPDRFGRGRLVGGGVKVIGGSPGNANQDGMDFLGGGDTVVMFKDTPAARALVTYLASPEAAACTKCHRIYPVVSDIPVMLVDEAFEES